MKSLFVMPVLLGILIAFSVSCSPVKFQDGVALNQSADTGQTAGTTATVQVDECQTAPAVDLYSDGYCSFGDIQTTGIAGSPYKCPSHPGMIFAGVSFLNSKQATVFGDSQCTQIVKQDRIAYLSYDSNNQCGTLPATGNFVFERSYTSFALGSDFNCTPMGDRPYSFTISASQWNPYLAVCAWIPNGQACQDTQLEPPSE